MRLLVVDMKLAFPAVQRERLEAAGVQVTQVDIPRAVSASAAADGALDSAAILRASEAAGGCDVLLNSGGVVTAGEVLPKLPGLKAVIRMGSGFENIPVDEATSLGIVVMNTPRANIAPVSEHAVALLLAAARQIPMLDRSLHDGSFAAGAGAWNVGVNGHVPVTTAGSTVGLLGFGAIARAVATKLGGFDLAEIIACDAVVDESTMNEGLALPCGRVRKVELDELLRSADFLSVHVPLLPSTHHLLSNAEFKKMKPNAILVNTARGPVVDESALIHALRSGEIKGAALDVLEDEPVGSGHAVESLDNLILTPHSASANPKQFGNFVTEAADVVLALVRDERPQTVVNPAVLEMPTRRMPLAGTGAGGIRAGARM